jgi:hypothetical protein
VGVVEISALTARTAVMEPAVRSLNLCTSSFTGFLVNFFLVHTEEVVEVLSKQFCPIAYCLLGRFLHNTSMPLLH